MEYKNICGKTQENQKIDILSDNEEMERSNEIRPF